MRVTLKTSPNKLSNIQNELTDVIITANKKWWRYEKINNTSTVVEFIKCSFNAPIEDVDNYNQMIDPDGNKWVITNFKVNSLNHLNSKITFDAKRWK